MGEPRGPGSVDVGAITLGPQMETISEHVRDAEEKGARVLVGGHAHTEHGRYFEPTVLVDVDHSMKCMTEETFGPTLPIMKVRDVEEAVKLDPTFSEAWEDLAVLYEKTGDAKKALEAFRKAKKLARQ